MENENPIELDKMEKATLQMFRSSTKQAEKVFDSCKRKQQRYENFLMIKICEKMGINPEEICVGECHCKPSPIGKCAYQFAESEGCIFCGEPEECK